MIGVGGRYVASDTALKEITRMKPRRPKLTAIFVIAAIVVVVAGCGTGGTAAGPKPRDAVRRTSFQGLNAIAGVTATTVGVGARSAEILTPSRKSQPGAKPPVIFLHAWGPTTPFLYKAWLHHLVTSRTTVIYPAYQSPTSSPADMLTNLQAGVRASLARLGEDPTSVVVAGHTTGATLALDYAASAATAGLPPACAVYGVFPSAKPGLRTAIPLSDLRQIPPGTKLLLIAGSSDPVPGGTELAQALGAQAGQIPRARRTVLLANDNNPNGPIEQSAASRHTYWEPLDHLVTECRRR
jgi:pimeloyl-ACP methyl ester carboxylesterase